MTLPLRYAGEIPSRSEGRVKTAAENGRICGMKGWLVDLIERVLGQILGFGRVVVGV